MSPQHLVVQFYEVDGLLLVERADEKPVALREERVEALRKETLHLAQRAITDDRTNEVVKDLKRFGRSLFKQALAQAAGSPGLIHLKPKFNQGEAWRKLESIAWEAGVDGKFLPQVDRCLVRGFGDIHAPRD